MNSSIISVSELLNSVQNFSSAGFSEGYSFNGEDAAKYFEELLSNSETGPIFSGILILEKSPKKTTIIDGLQRLTTISLLLCALCDTYKNTSQNNEEARKKILSRFLIDSDNQYEPKLKLKKQEHDIFKNILFDYQLNENDINSNLFQAYQAFLSKIKEYKISGTALFTIVSRIQFMTVITEKSEVSVREIYQALNKNKGQSQINLISDYVSQQSESAENIWQNITESFKSSEYLFECFIRDFLITRIDKEITDNSALYNNFKNYFHKISKYQSTEEILQNIYKYSKYYLKVLKADFEDSEIKEQITILNENDGKDTYPYLMEVLDDLENSHLNQGAFLNILMMINLFIKNRQESSFSNVNINFSNLSKELNKMLILKDYVPEMIEEDKLTINMINKLTNFEV